MTTPRPVRPRPIGYCPTIGKAQFTDKRLAKRQAKAFRDDARPYRCQHCGYWHLGHLGQYTRAQHREHAKDKA